MSLVPYPPANFDAFWDRAIDQALDHPLHWDRSPSDFKRDGFKVDLIEFEGISGSRLHGWVAVPVRAANGLSFLWTPPYGRESLLPNDYGTRRGLVSLSFNFFGHSAFHQEAYRRERGYFAEGVESPETWIFRRMAQDAVLALRVLHAQPEVEPSRVGAMGMSQGAGISIWLGARSGMVRAVCADMPFLGGMPHALSRTVYRYPLKELIDRAETLEGGKERILTTLAYFDTLNQATRCAVPTLVSLGEKDPAVRPETAVAIYEALPGHKVLHRYPTGHDWYPEMVQNNAKWLEENLK